MIKVDIATKIIAPETGIWVVFPGRSRRLLNAFHGHNAIFLETPGLDLRPEKANDVAAIRQRVRMSHAIQQYLRATGPTKTPSRNPDSYEDGPLEDGSLTVLATNIRKMFAKMKVGDLIIVPDKLFAPIYFAEVVSDFLAKDTISIERYGNERIPVRKIRWLNDGVSRNLVPISLQQKYLSKPPAISAVGRSFQSDEFFKLAYPAFILAEKSAVIMEGPKYDGHNPLATHEANFLVAYFVSAFNAIENNKFEEFLSLGVKPAIESYFDPSLIQSFTQNYNSPGKSGLTAKSAILGAFVSVGIAVALTGLAASEWNKGIEVTNSISPTDDHTKDATVKLDYLFKSLGQKEIDELNQLAEKAKKHIGLETPVQVQAGEP